MDTTLFPSCYLGPTSYYSLLLQSQQPVIEKWEHYTKQTYRNRTDSSKYSEILEDIKILRSNGHIDNEAAEIEKVITAEREGLNE